MDSPDKTILTPGVYQPPWAEQNSSLSPGSPESLSRPKRSAPALSVCKALGWRRGKKTQMWNYDQNAQCVLFHVWSWLALSARLNIMHKLQVVQCNFRWERIWCPLSKLITVFSNLTKHPMRHSRLGFSSVCIWQFTGWKKCPSSVSCQSQRLYPVAGSCICNSALTSPARWKSTCWLPSLTDARRTM